MANGPATTKENPITSAAKSTRGQKSVLGFSGHWYEQSPPILSACTVRRNTLEVKPYKFYEGSDAKKRAIRRQKEPPPIRSIYATPKEFHHHSSSIPSPIFSIVIAITILIEISLIISDHCQKVFATMNISLILISCVSSPHELRVGVNPRSVYMHLIS
jgi:hypothetical protein